MSGQELDLNRGGAVRRGAGDADAEYVPGTRSNFPANDSLAGLAYGVAVLACAFLFWKGH